MIYSFGGNRLDATRYALTRDGVPIPVEPQVFDVLHLLARNAGRLVSRDALIDAVWQGRIVSEATISARISAARTAIGDSGQDQRMIRTVPRRGFELVVPVTVEEAAAPETAPASAPPPPEIRQTIRYAASADGTNIAWSSAGQGPAVLYGWHHFSHLEQDWTSGLLRRGLAALSASHRLVRYDIRGSGLSDPIRPGDGLDQHVADMIAVADAAGLERFPIVATLQASAVAIRLAAQFPERVSRLVLHNGYARGRAMRENAPEAADTDPFIALLKSGAWGDPDNGFMRAWATMVLPMASTDEITELIQLIAHACSTEEALLQRNLIDRLSVVEDLPRVRAPALVIHTRLCTIHPSAEGRRVAAGLRDAEFLEVDSSNTFPISSDPAFERVFAATLEFLARDETG